MVLNWFPTRPMSRLRHHPNDAETVQVSPAPELGTRRADGADTHSPSWPDVVRQLGQEVTAALGSATEQLDRLNRLEPTLVRSLAALSESVERARQAALAAQHVLRLCEDPPRQQREVLNLAHVARAALTARGNWFKRHGIQVRQGLLQSQVYADSSMLYLLVDEMLLWAGHLASEIAVSVDQSQRSGRPRLRVAAWCTPDAEGSPAWRDMRWLLWHQLARAVGAHTKLEMRDDHVRVTLSLAPVTEDQLATAIDENVGPSSVSAVVQGCRVLVISHQAQRRAQCVQALYGYGVIIDVAEDMPQAERMASERLPDALVYDASVNASELERLRASIGERSGTPTAVIEIDEQAGASEFHASTVGAISTGHVAAGALQQSLGPALVFELCKVI